MFAADVYLCSVSVKLYLIALLWHLMVFPVFLLMYVLSRGYQTLEGLVSAGIDLAFLTSYLLSLLLVICSSFKDVFITY